MSTNFYWVAEDGLFPTGEEDYGQDRDDPRQHIGKRSAAGFYCWDCGVTLCKDGETGVHTGRSEWHDACPKCGGTRDISGHSPAMVELGFQKPAQERPRGVRGCASFSWAQDPERVKQICRERSDQSIVQDEYGRDMTGAEFLRMLTFNCPIESTHSLGMVFC